MRKETLMTRSRFVLSLLLTSLALSACGTTTESTTAGSGQGASTVAPSVAIADSTATNAGNGQSAPAAAVNLQQKTGKIAVVAKNHGDYTSPVAALNDIASWCGTPSATNPCLLKIMPGVYDLAGGQLNLPPYVNLEGSGENATTISSATTGDVVLRGDLGDGELVSTGEISNLTVKNPSGPAIGIGSSQKASISNVTAVGYGIAIANGGSATLTNVKASAAGAAENIGIATGWPGANVTMNNVSATAEGGSLSCGIWTIVAQTTMTNVTATASRATTNYGVFTGDAVTTMNHVIATAEGGSLSSGVFIGDGAVNMSNVTAAAWGATSNYGVYGRTDADPSGVTANQSTFRGATDSIHLDWASLATVASSEFIGPISTTGSFTCTNSFNDNHVALGANCLPLTQSSATHSSKEHD